ncbi:hypothetical protein HOG98_08855 [bacterium]|nr:hypothetical protein [bacterium]
MSDVDDYVVRLLKWYGYISEKENGHVSVTDYDNWARESDVETDDDLKSKIYTQDVFPEFLDRLTKKSITSLFNLISPSFYLYEKTDNYSEKLTQAVQKSNWANFSEAQVTRLSVVSYNDFFTPDTSETVIKEITDCLFDYSKGDYVSEDDVGKSLFILHVLSEQCRDSSHAIAIDIFRTITMDVLHDIKNRAKESLFIQSKIDHVKERHTVLHTLDGCNLCLWFIDGTIKVDGSNKSDLLNTLIRLNAPSQLFEEFCEQIVIFNEIHGRGFTENSVYQEIIGRKISNMSVCFYLNPRTLDFLMDKVMSSKHAFVMSINRHNKNGTTPIFGLQEIKYRDPDKFQHYILDKAFLGTMTPENFSDIYCIAPGNDALLKTIFAMSGENILKFLNYKNYVTKTDYPLLFALEKENIRIFRYFLDPENVKKIGNNYYFEPFSTHSFGGSMHASIFSSSDNTMLKTIMEEDNNSVVRLLFSTKLLYALNSFCLVGLGDSCASQFLSQFSDIIIDFILNKDTIENYKEGKYLLELVQNPWILTFLLTIDSKGMLPIFYLLSNNEFVEGVGRDETSSQLNASSNDLFESLSVEERRRILSSLLSLSTIRKIGFKNVDKILSYIDKRRLINFLYEGAIGKSLIETCLGDSDFIAEVGKDWMCQLVYPHENREPPEVFGFNDDLYFSVRLNVCQFLLDSEVINYLGAEFIVSCFEEYQLRNSEYDITPNYKLTNGDGGYHLFLANLIKPSSIKALGFENVSLFIDFSVVSLEIIKVADHSRFFIAEKLLETDVINSLGRDASTTLIIGLQLSDTIMDEVGKVNFFTFLFTLLNSKMVEALGDSNFIKIIASCEGALIISMFCEYTNEKTLIQEVVQSLDSSISVLRTLDKKAAETVMRYLMTPNFADYINVTFQSDSDFFSTTTIILFS